MTQFDPTNDDLDEDDVDQSDVNDPAQIRKQLRTALRRNKEFQAELNEVAKVRVENAFLKAGLPDSPTVKFFQDHYSGEPTPEAIRTAAAEFGFIPRVDDQTAQEIAALDRQSQALIGSDESMNPDSREAMMKEFEAEVRAGRNGELVLRKYGHAVASDER